MRARYVIRDMANGSAKAWRQAEWKLRQDNIHETPRKDLSDALATLPDPRERKTPAPDPRGRRFAIEVHAGEDWGDNPAVRDTGYDFTSVEAAAAEATAEMWRQYCLGTPRHEIGAYVTSDDTDANGEPTVHELISLP